MLTAIARRSYAHILVALLNIASAALFVLPAVSSAAHHYTEKQIAALSDRVGKTYWIYEINGRAPSFVVAPQAEATSFSGRAGDSFQIIEVVGQASKNPFYRIIFASGREAYLRPEVMLEELNLTIMTVDPFADAKRKEAVRAQDEKLRADWINAQPWPPEVKEAARRGQVLPGMTQDEVKKIAGAPSRVTKVQGQGRGTTPEEYWIYPDNKQLVFQQGLLSRIIHTRNAKSP
jgi:hypothetical protein